MYWKMIDSVRFYFQFLELHLLRLAFRQKWSRWNFTISCNLVLEFVICVLHKLLQNWKILFRNFSPFSCSCEFVSIIREKSCWKLARERKKRYWGLQSWIEVHFVVRPFRAISINCRIRWVPRVCCRWYGNGLKWFPPHHSPSRKHKSTIFWGGAQIWTSKIKHKGSLFVLSCNALNKTRNSKILVGWSFSHWGSW